MYKTSMGGQLLGDIVQSVRMNSFNSEIISARTKKFAENVIV